MPEDTKDISLSTDRTEKSSKFVLPETLEEALGLEYSSLLTDPELKHQFMIYDETRKRYEQLIQKAVNGEQSVKKVASIMAAHTLSLQRATDKEYEAARTDPLTQLPNRLAFLEELERHFNAHETTLALIGDKPIEEYTPEELELLKSTSFGVLQGDFDRFKDVNDSLGHDGGDEILIIGANRFKNSVRQGHIARPDGLKIPRDIANTDFVARIGGEEVVAIISGVITEEQLAEAGERIVGEYNSSPFVTSNGIEVKQTISLGGAVYRRGDPMKTYKLADQRAYGAKQHGRNYYIGDIVGPRIPDISHG